MNDDTGESTENAESPENTESTENTESPRFTSGLSELVLPVNDLGRALRFYRDVLGLVPESVSEEGAWLWTGTPEDSARLGLASRSRTTLAERAASYRMSPEARQMAGGLPAPPSTAHPRGGDTDPLAFAPADLGRAHFALRVPRSKLADAVERLRDAGVRVAGPLDFRWMKAVSCFVRDPEGNAVELWSPDPDGVGPAAAGRLT